MEPNNQPHYPLLEALLRTKGQTLRATYTTADVAHIFECSPRAVQYRCADGTLNRRQLIGRARFLPIDLENFLAGKTRGGGNSGV